MTAVVLADTNWGIAKNGSQIVTIKKDLLRFKEMTKGKTVIFGRKTLEHFPGGKPLPGRINICVSRTLKEKDYPGLIILRDISDIASIGRDVFCIGGAEIYRQFYPRFERVEVTRVLYDYRADLYFPPIDMDREFERTNWSAKQHDYVNDVDFRFETYTRRRR